MTAQVTDQAALWPRMHGATWPRETGDPAVCGHSWPLSTGHITCSHRGCTGWVPCPSVRAAPGRLCHQRRLGCLGQKTQVMVVWRRKRTFFSGGRQAGCSVCRDGSPACHPVRTPVRGPEAGASGSPAAGLVAGPNVMPLESQGRMFCRPVALTRRPRRRLLSSCPRRAPFLSDR